jgi:hypothetical protein
MAEVPVCLDCGLADPPPGMTCDGGTVGGTPRDHFVGVESGCAHCGRLMAACRARPCSAVRAIDDELGS